jgi:hypothetical protein
MNVESKAVAKYVALDVGYEDPPFQDVSLPGMAPMKELCGFEELGDKSDPQTTKQDEESLQDDEDEDAQEKGYSCHDTYWVPSSIVAQHWQPRFYF